MTVDFATFPLTNGQLVQGPDGWCLTARGQSTDPMLIAAWQEEYTLLLPSRAQCEAAGLTCWDALGGITEPWAGESVPYHRCIDLGSGNRIHMELTSDARGVGGRGPIVVKGLVNSHDPEQFTTAANRLSALQAWLATWEAATPGPWHRLHDPTPEHPSPANPNCKCAQVWSLPADHPVAYCDTREHGEGFTPEQQMLNAAFIAATRTATPELCRCLLEQLDGLEPHLNDSVYCGEGASTGDVMEYARNELATAQLAIIAAHVARLEEGGQQESVDETNLSAGGDRVRR